MVQPSHFSETAFLFFFQIWQPVESVNSAVATSLANCRSFIFFRFFMVSSDQLEVVLFLSLCCLALIGHSWWTSIHGAKSDRTMLHAFGDSTRHWRPKTTTFQALETNLKFDRGSRSVDLELVEWHVPRIERRNSCFFPSRCVLYLNWKDDPQQRRLRLPFLYNPEANAFEWTHEVGNGYHYSIPLHSLM